MGQPEALIVSAFKGIHRPSTTGRTTTRRVLDEPREMYNFFLDSDGHLFMPKCPNLFYDFTSDGASIKTINFVERPQGFIIQMDNGKIFHIGRDPATGDWDPDPINPKLIATISPGEEQYNIWVNATRQGYALMGYKPRGSAGPAEDGVTWKITGPHNDAVATALDDSVVGTASWSTIYKGRRFWVGRGRAVSFSPLNELDAAAEDTFVISGDDAGNTFIDSPGVVQGMISWEDVLVFFLNGSVWILTGGSPETFQLRQAETIVGNSSSWTLVRVDDGIMTIGGSNLTLPGLYRFTGNRAERLSGVIEDWMRSLGRLTATVKGENYILGTSRGGETNRQFLLYNMKTGQWNAFDGWVLGTCYMHQLGIFISRNAELYLGSGAISFPRAPGRGARVLLGYHDDQNPTGLNRYLGVKVTGRYWGTGTPTIKVTATTSLGVVTSGDIDLPSNVFDSLVLPLNIRGSAIEFLLEVTPANDNNEVLLENLQVIVSRKGEKVSRG